jgi:hypothetical protein
MDGQLSGRIPYVHSAGIAYMCDALAILILQMNNKQRAFFNISYNYIGNETLYWHH